MSYATCGAVRGYAQLPLQRMEEITGVNPTSSMASTTERLRLDPLRINQSMQRAKRSVDVSELLGQVQSKSEQDELSKLAGLLHRHQPHTRLWRKQKALHEFVAFAQNEGGLEPFPGMKATNNTLYAAAPNERRKPITINKHRNRVLTSKSLSAVSPYHVHHLDRHAGRLSGRRPLRSLEIFGDRGKKNALQNELRLGFFGVEDWQDETTGADGIKKKDIQLDDYNQAYEATEGDADLAVFDELEDFDELNK
jgi:hypothetical protein